MSYSKAHKYSDVLEEISFLSKAISHPARLKILIDLQNGPKRILEMQENHPIAPKTLSYHSQILLSAQLISAEAKGNFIYYSYNDSIIPSLVKKAMQEAQENKISAFIPITKKKIVH